MLGEKWVIEFALCGVYWYYKYIGVERWVTIR